jgi:hypothetical protein
MKPLACCLAALMFLSTAPSSWAGQSSMPGMIIMVKSKAKEEKNPMVSMTITDYLMKHKMPQWNFLDSMSPDNLGRMMEENLGTKAPGSLDGLGGADVIVEFSVERKDSENVVVLTIAARDPFRNKELFSKSAPSSRRNLKQPGASNRATMEAAEKVLPEVVTGLTEHYWSLSRKGTWCRVILENAPKGLEKKVEDKLKKDCTQTERSPGEPGFLVQCKLDSFELFARVEKAIKAAAPRATYEFTTKTAKNIKLEFQAPEKRGKKKGRKNKR